MMSALTLKRKSNFIGMKVKYEIFIDNTLYDSISNGEIKIIDLPKNSKELTVKTKYYISKPILLNFQDFEAYEIRQNIIVNTVSAISGLLIGLFIISKFSLGFLYVAIPFLLITLYYSTIGRRNYILVEKIIDKKTSDNL